MNNEKRQQIIKDFLHNPERTIYEQIDEFKTAIETLVNIFKDSKLSEVDSIVGKDGEKGEDGNTPVRGEDFMTEDDINAFESFLIDKMPQEGIDYPTFVQLHTYIKEQVAKIPVLKGDKGESIKGEPGANGSPDSPSQIINKLRSLGKNQGLQIKDIRGLDNKIKSIDDLILEVEKKIDEQKIYISTGSGGTGGESSVTSIDELSPLQFGNAGKFLKTNGTNASWESIPGSGDMLKSTYDPEGGAKQVAFADAIPDAQIQSDWTQTTNTAKDYIKNKPTIPDVSGKEDVSNKVTEFSSPTNTQYPSAKLVKDQLDTKQIAGSYLVAADITNKVDKVTGSSLITDASITRLANTSGTNTGDNATNSSSATSAQGTLATNALPKSGGTMTGDILGAVSYGDTGTRVTKIWATDLEITNAPTVGGVKLGYLEIPQNSKSAAYTTVLADSGKHILHPSADTTARTFTIDSNANVAYPIGTAITFINQNAGGVITIAITTDTMRLAGAGTTGSRTLAANGVATAIKITATEWIVSGTNLT